MTRFKRDEVARVPRHRIEREAAELLEGRAPPELKRLASLIRDVNPTGRDLSRVETLTRYALKSRLQSLLIRTYRDELRVVPDARGEHTVSIAHRFHPIDGCHAIVADLDDDARAWVRWRLDTRDSLLPPPSWAPPSRRPSASTTTRCASAAPPSPPSTSKSPATTWSAPTPSARRPRRPTSSSSSSITSATTTRPSGSPMSSTTRPSRASRCARGSGSPTRDAVTARRPSGSRSTSPPTRAADVYVALGREALLAEDVGYARRMHEAARAVDPTRVELEALTEGVARLEVHERARAEEALLRAREEGAWDEVGRRARAILARWPGSEPAKRALRENRDREHAAAMARHLAEAARALDAESLLEAKTAIEAARALGAVVTNLESRLAHGLSTARARAEQAKVERVRHELLNGDLATALGEYLALDDAQRRGARRGVSLDALGWIGEILASAPRARPAQVVEAVLALRRALDAEARGDLAPAAALTAHQRLLGGCAAAGALADRLAAARREDLRRANRAVLDEARAALAAGDTLLAQRRLNRVDARLLNDDERAEVAAMHARITELNARAARADALSRCEQAGELFAARGHAASLIARTEEPERARWLDVDAGLAERERARARRWELAGSAPVGLLAARSDRFDNVEFTLDAARGELVALNALGPWMLIDVFDVARGLPLRSVSLRLPAAFDGFTAHLAGDALLLLSSDGDFARIDRRTLELVAWRAESEILERGCKSKWRYVSPDGRRAWLVTTGARRGPSTVVVDIDAWAVHRDIPGQHWVRPIPGPSQAMCLFDRVTQRGDIVDAEGRPLTPVVLAPGRNFFGFIEHPRGGFFALRTTDRAKGDLRGDLCLSRVMPDGSLADGPVIATRCGESGHEAVASHERECVFVLFTGAGDERRLVAIDARDDELRERYSLRVPHRAVLFTDRDARRAVAVSDGFDRLQVVPLDRDPPGSLIGRAWSRRDTPDLAPPFACDPFDSPSDDEKAPASLARVAAFDERGLDAWVRRLTDAKKDPAPVTSAVRLLAASGLKDSALVVALAAARRFPRHPDVALALADTHALSHRWRDALDALATTPEDALTRHGWHLTGAAHAFLGDASAARRAWARGAPSTAAPAGSASAWRSSTTPPLPRSATTSATRCAPPSPARAPPTTTPRGATTPPRSARSTTGWSTPASTRSSSRASPSRASSTSPRRSRRPSVTAACWPSS